MDILFCGTLCLCIDKFALYFLLSGSDFSNHSMTLTVPAAVTPGTQTYTIPTFFSVVDDPINEVEQSFALVAEMGADLNVSCFQTQVGETECFGRRGATEIRIADNDCKCIYTLG